MGFGIPLFCTTEIPPVARRVGIDSALAAALVAAESGFDPRAVSHTGARGLTQLTSRTARSLGVYNRHWPRWNLWGGLTYLSQQQKRFGDDDLALAAYNVGPTRVARKGKSVLKDPAVSQYVSRIRSLRRAYAKRYPQKCLSGGNSVGVAFAEHNDAKIYALGWGIDLQAFLEFGIGAVFTDDGDSTTRDPIVGTRIYLFDPFFVAGTYNWDSREWVVGALTSVRGERVLLHAELEQDNRFHLGVDVALPLGLGVGIRWRKKTLGVNLSATAGSWHVTYAQSRHDGDEQPDPEISHTISFSIGHTPML